MENKKVLRKFKKAKNFDKLNAAVKEESNYKNTKYESNEKKVQDKDRRMKNFMILNDFKKKFIMHYLNALF